MPQLEAGFDQQAHFRQNYVCMVSADHPRIGSKLSLAQFEAEDHEVVTTSGTGHLILDREIARQGISRRITLRIPNFLGVAFVIEHTDLLVTIPRRLGEVLRGAVISGCCRYRSGYPITPSSCTGTSAIIMSPATAGCGG